MTELKDILKTLETLEHSEKCALATVVNVKGSAYRRPGARLLIAESGHMAGMISAGCLENDVLERARIVIKSGEPALVKYDATSPEDILWGLGHGCNGIVEVLIEPLSPNRRIDALAFLRECIEQQTVGTLATVFRTSGKVKTKLGSCLLMREEKNFGETIKDPELATSLRRDCAEALRSGKSRVKTYKFTQGSIEVFIEVVHPPLPLVIFGAGPDVVSLARFANDLGWNVTIADRRPANAVPDLLRSVHSYVQVDPENISNRVVLNPQTAVVVMTHNFLTDLELLKQLLPSPVRYLGLLGPRKRTDLLLQKLSDQGFRVTDEHLAKLRAPVGIDIGAETAEEIAISIIGEIQAVTTGRVGGFMKERKGPIHE